MWSGINDYMTLFETEGEFIEAYDTLERPNVSYVTGSGNVYYLDLIRPEIDPDFNDDYSNDFNNTKIEKYGKI